VRSKEAVSDLQTPDAAESVGGEAIEGHARGSRHAPCSVPSITVRPSPEVKACFKLLAQHVGLSESALALNAICALLDRDEEWLRRQSPLNLEHVAATDRITIRLRPGDGLAVIRRASERGVRPATYISALVRAHITADPPLTSAELNALKLSISVLAGLGTVLANTSRQGIPSGAQGEVYREAIRRTRGEIAALEQRIVDLTRAAMIAWETRS
jgi:predicted DNA binding CopG/RHH family protein